MFSPDYGIYPDGTFYADCIRATKPPPPPPPKGEIWNRFKRIKTKPDWKLIFIVILFVVDLIFLGGETIAELPSFTVKSDCDVPPHPVEGLEDAVTGIVDGKVMTCGGEFYL